MKKRALSLLLALALCVGLATPAFAASTSSIAVEPGLYEGIHYNIEIRADGSVVLTGESEVYEKMMPFTVTISSVVKITTEPFGSTDQLLNVIWLPPTGATVTYEVNPASVYIGSYPVFDDDGAVIDSPSCALKSFAAHVWNSEAGFYECESVGVGYIPEITAAQATFTDTLEGTLEEWAGYVETTGYGNVSFNFSFAAPEESTADGPSDWAAESVSKATEAGLVPEALQEKFSQPTTRAEFCALAVALYETVLAKEATRTDIAFTDTEDVNVLKMASLGVVNGVGEGKFDPNATLTREQAATMLARLAAALEKPLEAAAPTFIDNEDISAWALDAVGQMQKSGVMGGVGDNTFDPAGPYTREQSIVTILRLFDLVK